MAQLRARAISLSNWYSITFPTRNITPKLHWVIQHIPEYAETMRSAGMTNEQVIESFHASMNHFRRFYACIQNTEQRYKAQAKNQWARSAGGVGCVLGYVSKAAEKQQARQSRRNRKKLHHTHIKCVRKLRRMHRFGWYEEHS